jgi:hypothetical protein
VNIRYLIRYLMSVLTLVVLMDAKDAASFEEWVARSQFVFKGTVTQVNAATLPEIRATASTIIVKVDEVLVAPAILGDYTGKDVTVQLNQPGAVETGKQFVFFTTSWIYL